MQLSSPPFWILPFSTRKIGVALHSIRGLVLLDPSGQHNLPEDRVRLYVAQENLLYVLYSKHSIGHLALPKSEKQAWLGVRAYKAFLNPRLPRPSQLDGADSIDWSEFSDCFDDGEGTPPDPRWRENDSIRSDPDPD
jgi:hypothetical protein